MIDYHLRATDYKKKEIHYIYVFPLDELKYLACYSEIRIVNNVYWRVRYD